MEYSDTYDEWGELGSPGARAFYAYRRACCSRAADVNLELAWNNMPAGEMKAWQAAAHANDEAER